MKTSLIDSTCVLHTLITQDFVPFCSPSSELDVIRRVEHGKSSHEVYADVSTNPIADAIHPPSTICGRERCRIRLDIGSLDIGSSSERFARYSLWISRAIGVGVRSRASVTVYSNQ